MRALFRAGQLGAKVMFFFDHVGMIEATHATAGLDLETVAIESGAQDFEAIEAPDEGSAGRFYTEPKDLDAATAHLRANGWSVVQSEMGYKPKELANISPEVRQEHEAFLETIDDHDDCHRIYTA
jgi:transcriptional/translational regulatory protein YebC/TACO1